MAFGCASLSMFRESGFDMVRLADFVVHKKGEEVGLDVTRDARRVELSVTCVYCFVEWLYNINWAWDYWVVKPPGSLGDPQFKPGTCL